MTKNLIHLSSLPASDVKHLLPKPKQIPLIFKGPLNSFKDIDDIPFDSYEFQHDIIKPLLKKINKNLIKYNQYKVFFIHPIFKEYSCDIFGNVFNISQFVKHKQVIYDDTIFLESLSKCYIRYDYLKFKKECIPCLKPFIFYKNMLRNIEHNEKQRDEYYELDKQRDEKTKKILKRMEEEEKLKKDHNEYDNESDTESDNDETDD